MADPLFGTSIFEGLKRDAMHDSDIQHALEDLRKRLGELNVPFALIGALAMRQRGFVRFTEDIDIVTTREGLDKIHEHLVGRGILPRATGLRKKLRDTVHKVNIDVIQEGEHAGSGDSPLVYPHPHSDAFADEGGLRVATLEKLVEFKLVSGQWGNRPDDFGDVFNLIKSNRLGEPFAQKLIPEVRAKYLELLEQSRKEIEPEG
jgi:hypothetical protein